MKLSRILSVLALAGLCSTAVAAPPVTARFIVDVKIDGSGNLQDRGAQANVKISQTVRMAVSLSGPRERSALNPLDMSAEADLVARQNVANAEAAQANMPSEAKQNEIAQRAEKAIAACKNDIACMQRVSDDLTRQTASWYAAPVAAPVAGPSEARYLVLHSGNQKTCKGEYNVRIEDSVEGTVHDVQGLVPFSRRMSAVSSGRPGELMQVCTAGMIVHEVKTDKIWASMAFPPVRGRYVTTRGKRTMADEDGEELLLNEQAVAWISKQLLGVPRVGKKRTTLRYPSSESRTHNGDEVVNVEISWRYEGSYK